MAEEEEVMAEVEAAEAVYGGDCLIIRRYPPHLHLHLKPRTADNSAIQFVEADLAIRAGPQYPNEPPHIDIIESKGLDEQRQKHLLTCIEDKARELSSCLMLVALCEEAVEKLSFLNHPDGDCPLCLHPLVQEDEENNLLPFMKLMSCYHCFHSECIIRWWNWIQTQKQANTNNSSRPITHPSRAMRKDMHETMEESEGNCPVCRKIFHTRDIEHVLDLVGSQSSQLSNGGTEFTEDEKILLHSDSEKTRRQKFEAILNLQQQNSGLIEPKRNEVLMPGMFIQQPPAAAALETVSCSSSNRPIAIEHRSSRTKNHRIQNPRRQVKQWVKKDDRTGG